MGMLSNFFGNTGKAEKKKMDQIYYLTYIGVIPEYFVDESGLLKGPPDTWQVGLLSYSFYIGLGVSLYEKKLAQNLNCGAQQFRNTCDLCLIGFNTIEKTEHSVVGDLWDHSVNYLNNFMSLVSTETIGPKADMKLVKERAPLAGFTPGLIIGIEKTDFAVSLFEDAIKERGNCDRKELIDRINYMKYLTDEVMVRLGKKLNIK